MSRKPTVKMQLMRMDGDNNDMFILKDMQGLAYAVIHRDAFYVSPAPMVERDFYDALMELGGGGAVTIEMRIAE